MKQVTGKGAPDGVGGVLKRTADRLVSEGKDIPNARQLYESLLSVQTSIQLFYIEEEAVNKAVQKMPKQLPVVPSTMRLHQMITQAPGKVIYRDVSCPCSTKQILECTCHNSQRFEFDVQPLLCDTTEEQQKTAEIKWESKDMNGQWCVINKMMTFILEPLLRSTRHMQKLHACTRWGKIVSTGQTMRILCGIPLMMSSESSHNQPK